jgi:flagellar protein FliS
MFNSPQTFGSRRPITGAYRDINASTAIDGANPHRLVSLLYGHLSSEITLARGAMARGDVALKGLSISRAVRVVEEGLNAPLNMVAGGELAANLRSLYEYLARRLTVANARNDDSALVECLRLVQTLREGWDGIADRVQPARVDA